MSSNTSFERIITVLNDRNSFIGQLHDLIHDSSLEQSPIYKQPSVAAFIQHIDDGYELYVRLYNELSLYMIGIIHDYYTIVDSQTDQFHPRYISRYAAHSHHYNNFNQLESSNLFDVNELIKIYNEHCYEFKVFQPFADVDDLKRAKHRSKIVYNKLSTMIASKNICDTTDTLVRNIGTLVEKIRNTGLISNRDSDSIISSSLDLIAKYEQTKFDIVAPEEVFDRCECGNIMEVMHSTSEMACKSCGYSTKLIGTVFDDNQFYNQDGGRYKHAGYSSLKHCKCWLERIQAKESHTITQDQLDKIDACIRRDRITNRRKITVSQLRQYLKSCKLTELNDHIASIKKMITGIGPAQLTFAETQDIMNSFGKAVKAYSIVRPTTKSNMLFTGYLLVKLIEIHVKDSLRRKSLLSYVHLQGTSTLLANDRIWQAICEIVPSLTYTPTDRHQYVD